MQILPSGGRLTTEPLTPQDLTAVYRRYLAAIVGFHLAAADEVGLGATDYQASNVLELDGPLTSGELATRLGLSTGATTRAIDRLETAGYARRTPTRPTAAASLLHTPSTCRSASRRSSASCATRSPR